jgi:hypothetical protein
MIIKFVADFYDRKGCAARGVIYNRNMISRLCYKVFTIVNYVSRSIPFTSVKVRCKLKCSIYDCNLRSVQNVLKLFTSVIYGCS